MNAIQQKCRPKHQVLVLKCYPRTTKGAVDVKPNSSELSYLLYYATSRKSKIQKIGAFLEKKTASDVWRLRIGNVQVTLQILAALLEKAHKDVALIAPYVLKILDTVLRSNDITMIESSLPTFEGFCEHHDATSLSADWAYLRQYEDVVRLYAQLASTQPPAGKAPVSRPVQSRWRTAGLEAVRSIATADALSSITGRQMNVIVPMILENLWTDDEDALGIMLQRAEADEKVDAEKPLKRRTSVATAGTVDNSGDTNPLALSGTALDVDKLAEEEIGVLAMQCLRNIFVVPIRSQIHNATICFLQFVLERMRHGQTVVNLGDSRERDDGWAIKIYNIISRWAPVQDRYVILVAAIDTLIQTPVSDDTLPQLIAITSMVGSLLRSDTNLVGLSVMDVLLALVRQLRKLFRLPAQSIQSDLADAKGGSDGDANVGAQRMTLLVRIEQCIGDLATHVYYADQVSDMISAIIVRLKPHRSTSSNNSPHGEKTNGNEEDPDSSNAEINESNSQLDMYFTLSNGRASALKVIKAILLVANPEKKITGNLALSRHRVPIQVWEGTQWLLREPDGNVRKAYVDVLVTWLERESTPAHLTAREEILNPTRSSIRNNKELQVGNGRRAVSTASNHREKSGKSHRSQFLPLLHLAIYDNAMQYVDYDHDVVVLHLLLTKLVFSLGVNAARYGIPMIYRLQEEVQEMETPVHKVRLAALCHGYLWALTEKFGFEGTETGRAINNEIVRRRSKGFWIEGIHVPPPQLESIGTPGQPRPQQNWDFSALESEELLPFDDKPSLIDCIAVGYEENAQSPPGSPVASPSRAISGPVLGSTFNQTAVTTEDDAQLPESFKELMMMEWSRDEAVALLESARKAESLTGTSVTKARLNLSNGGVNGNGHLPASSFGSHHNLRPRSSHAAGERDRLSAAVRFRKNSVRSGDSPLGSTSSRGGVASVEQLKMVLSGNASAQAAGVPPIDDDSGESMMSYEYTPSEMSCGPNSRAGHAGGSSSAPKRSLSAASRKGPLTAHPPHEGPPDFHEDGDMNGNGVPPVPPLPNLSFLANAKANIYAESPTQNNAIHKPAGREQRSRGEERARSRSVKSQAGQGRLVDLDELLRGIDSRSGEGTLGNVSRPPY